MNSSFFDILENRICETSDVYIPPDTDAGSYISGLTDSIRAHRCEPALVQAEVKEPGFPDVAVGDIVTGWCLAKYAGYWLVYQPDQDRFCCFWGADVDHLGAPGIFGSPLYCWSA